MPVLKSRLLMGVLGLPFLFSDLQTKGYLYDERNQYHVICRLTQEKNIKPFVGEDTVKCFYTCQDKEFFVITTHSDYPCEKEIASPRGDKRDWRKK